MGVLSLGSSRPLLPYCHSVNNNSPLHIKHLYDSRRAETFITDVNWLLKYYKPVSLDELHAWISGEKTLHPKSFHLSFDDGFRECADIIAPILKRQGVPATFFLCSAFLDNKNLFYRNKISLLLERFAKGLTVPQEDAVKKLFENQGLPFQNFSHALGRITFAHASLVDAAAELLGICFNDYLKHEQPYLTLEQVGDLIRDGFAIGAHSVDHPHYRDLSLDEQLWQTRESMDFISSRFSASCRAFAFPHTDTNVSLRFFREASKDVDIFFGTSRMKTDQLRSCLQRFSLEDARFSCAEIVKGNLLKQAYNSVIGQGNIQRNP